MAIDHAADAKPMWLNILHKFPIVGQALLNFKPLGVGQVPDLFLVACYASVDLLVDVAV